MKYNTSIENNDDSWYRIVYVCCRKENIKKTLFALRRKYKPDKLDDKTYIYSTIEDVEKCCSVKPIESSKRYRDRIAWIEWFIEKSDVVWLCDSGDFSKEIEIAKKYKKPVERH